MIVPLCLTWQNHFLLIPKNNVSVRTVVISNYLQQLWKTLAELSHRRRFILISGKVFQFFVRSLDACLAVKIVLLASFCISRKKHKYSAKKYNPMKLQGGKKKKKGMYFKFSLAWKLSVFSKAN